MNKRKREIRDRIIRLAIEKGFSKADIAYVFGVTRATVDNISKKRLDK